MFVRKKNRKYVRDVKMILQELQHRLVVIDLDEKILKQIVRIEQIVKKRM